MPTNESEIDGEVEAYEVISVAPHQYRLLLSVISLPFCKYISRPDVRNGKMLECGSRWFKDDGFKEIALAE